MGWDFETEPEYQEKVDWVDRFLREDVEPLDSVLGDADDKTDQQALAVVRPLQQQVRAQVMAIADGPTEVHKITVARQVLKGNDD